MKGYLKLVAVGSNEEHEHVMAEAHLEDVSLFDKAALLESLIRALEMSEGEFELVRIIRDAIKDDAEQIDLREMKKEEGHTSRVKIEIK